MRMKIIKPKIFLAGVILLSVVVANLINREKVVYFALIAVPIILYAWYLVYKSNITEQRSSKAIKVFALITFINLVIVYAITWYNRH